IAFGSAVEKRSEKKDAGKSGSGTGKDETNRGGRGDNGSVRPHRCTQEFEVPKDLVPAIESLHPNVPELHWADLPLADKFHSAARDRDGEGEKSGASGRRIKPSRSKRGIERSDNDKDFERER